MPTIRFDLRNPESFVTFLKKLSAHKPQEFVFDSKYDIVNWPNYFLFLLLDNISENKQHKYNIMTKNEFIMQKRINAYDKLYLRNTRELIKVENKGEAKKK